MIKRIVDRWHTLLDMPKQDADWHRQDMLDELTEYREAKGPINAWSKLSDVVYTYTRAVWSGHSGFRFPLSNFKFFVGALYMIPKYTLR